MPAGWSWWFGHMLVLEKKLQSLPPDVNVFTAMNDFVKDHADSEVFILDLWPVYQPMLMISGPEVATQAMKYDLPKPSDQEASFRPVVGGPSLISMNKEQWKFWRSLLNPGFSASHMLSLVPIIVDAMDVFCELLQEKVGNGVFSLDEMATRLTMDVIVKTSLDMDLDGQRHDHKLAHALRTILHWHSFWDPRILLNPLRIPIQWYYSSVMATTIDHELQKRFDEMKIVKATTETVPNRKQRVKSVAALVLEEYIIRKQVFTLYELHVRQILTLYTDL
jgi:cytochrome P450